MNQPTNNLSLDAITAIYQRHGLTPCSHISRVAAELKWLDEQLAEAATHGSVDSPLLGEIIALCDNVSIGAFDAIGTVKAIRGIAQRMKDGNK